jgi:hypothetical protein
VAIAVDASTPVRWAGTVALSAGGTIVSASFTAPADALLVLCANVDSTSGTQPTNPVTASDSGGLTWTTQVRRDPNESTNGSGSAIFTARTVSSVSRTVTLTIPTDGVAGDGWGTGRGSAKLYVLTGVDVDGTPVDTVTADNEGFSATNSMTTTAITAGANGLLVCNTTEWNALGSFQASSDLTQDTADYAGQVSVCSGYKAVTSGASVTGNLNAAGSSAAHHKWCQIVVREAAGGGGGTTRGMPFGMRGTAFNGGRTFRGLI